MDPILKAHLDRIEAEAPEMRASWEALDIAWHCPGRHGVVLGVPANRAGYVQRVIEWHVGQGACKWTKPVDGKQDVEFVHMTKVFPPPRKPWGWCGVTILFDAWKRREEAEKEAGQAFKRFDEVTFTYRGVTKTGRVIQVNRRTVSVDVEGEPLDRAADRPKAV
jgi:hypothetical protein